VIPRAARTASGYRVYTDDHAGALDVYVALLPGYGHRAAGEIMRSVLCGDLPTALAVIDTAHVQLQRDRETVDRVASAAVVLASCAPTAPGRTGLFRSVSSPTGSASPRPPCANGNVPASWPRPGRGPEDVRDAELTHLLHSGGYLLEHIVAVIEQVHTAGGPGPD
jgi:hypothetical protein